MSERLRRAGPFDDLFSSRVHLRENQPMVVIGAANMDLSGTPFRELRTGDSNPGLVRLSPGGVGRNIAENLVRLGRRVHLMTILGDDSWARIIREHCLNAGIDLHLTFTDEQARSSVYLCVNEDSGDLHAAVSDMSVYDLMTPERIRPFLRELNQAAMVLVDANIPEETVAFLAEHVTAPLAADPVSAAKALRLRPILSRLELLKPNRAEAELLTGIPVRSPGDYRRAADALHALGVRRVYLSLGAEGVWADDGRVSELIPCFPGEIRNTTGCGDAFVAAVADAWLNGLGTVEAGRRALAAAAVCAADQAAVSAALNADILNLMTNR